jgi:hypothetical protein
MAGDGSSTTLTPLYATGYDLTNTTQAMEFPAHAWDDSNIEISGKKYARNFWYGIVVVIGLAGILNLMWRVKLKLRYLAPISWRRTSPKVKSRR